MQGGRCVTVQEKSSMDAAIECDKHCGRFSSNSELVVPYFMSCIGKRLARRFPVLPHRNHERSSVCFCNPRVKFEQKTLPCLIQTGEGINSNLKKDRSHPDTQVLMNGLTTHREKSRRMVKKV